MPHKSLDELAGPALSHLKNRFSIQTSDDLNPRVFMRLTDNWVELTVRFLCKDHDIRGLQDRMRRDIKAGLSMANIGIASSTYDIVGLLPI